MNLQRIQQLAGINLTESVQAVPGVGKVKEGSLKEPAVSRKARGEPKLTLQDIKDEEARGKISHPDTLANNNGNKKKEDKTPAKLTEEVSPDEIQFLLDKYKSGEITFDEFNEQMDSLEHTDFSMHQGEMGLQGGDTPEGNRAFDREEDDWDMLDDPEDDPEELEFDESEFSNVSCSQCGHGFGPGKSGFSSCSEHNKPVLNFKIEDIMGKPLADAKKVAEDVVSECGDGALLHNIHAAKTPGEIVELLNTYNEKNMQYNVVDEEYGMEESAMYHPDEGNFSGDSDSDYNQRHEMYLNGVDDTNDRIKTYISSMYTPGSTFSDAEITEISDALHCDTETVWDYMEQNNLLSDPTLGEDFNNGYDKGRVVNVDSPIGAEGALIGAVGPSSAKQGDNPEQKKLAVAEAHSELVYKYRNFLKESSKK